MATIEYRKVVLRNGLTLVAERHPHVRAVSVGVWVRVGSAQEKPSLNGISHFIEHMVFKGTQKRTPLQIATVLECQGGDLNAFTDREVTCYHATVLSEHLELAFDVLSDLVMRPTFPKDELERERRVLLQELSMVEDSPEEWIGDLFFGSVWKGSTLGQPVIGTRENLKSISRASLMKFFAEHYRPDNMVLAVAGNVDLDSLEAKAEKWFDLAGTPKSETKKIKAPKFHPKKRAVSAPSEQLHLLVGFEGLSFTDPNRFNALILSFFLGGGMSSRLFQEIREKAGLAYSVDCDCIPYSTSGLFTISMATAPKSLKQCLGILGREINRLKDQEIPAKDLDLVKGQLNGTVLLSSDQMEVRQESLGRNEIVFGRYVPVDEIIQEIERVTPAKIHEVAKQIFVREKEAVLTLGKTKAKPTEMTVFG